MDHREKTFSLDNDIILSVEWSRLLSLRVRESQLVKFKMNTFLMSTVMGDSILQNIVNDFPRTCFVMRVDAQGCVGDR